jgi:tripartite-type tricarboxylate transporter receptor subunit TctC
MVMPRFVWACVPALLLACTFAGAQGYPSKPIRMLVGFTAGSEIDVIARMVAAEMSEGFSQKVLVDNRSGAGGTLSTAMGVASAPDGYTLMFNSVSHAAAPALYPKLPFNALRDLIAVSQVSSLPNMLTVPPSLGIKSVKELIELARQKPGQINFGSAGVGSGTHITGEQFRLGAGIEVVHVPYKGVPEVINDTAAARLHFSFAPIGNTLAFVKDKRLVPLAVSTASRSPLFPDVPTVAEAGVAGFDFDQWYGIFAPAGTPRPVVERIAKEVARVMALPEMRERLLARGAVPRATSPEEFDRFVRSEIAKLTKVITQGGVKVE